MQKEFELFDKYLRNNLSSKEFDLFELQLKQDHEFSERFVEYVVETALIVETGSTLETSKQVAFNLSTRKSTWYILTAVAALIFLVASITFFSFSTPLAKLSNIVGDVAIIRGGKRLPVFDEMSVLEDDTVITGFDSEADLRYSDGTSLHFAPETRSIFCSILGEGKRIKLLSGEVKGVVAHQPAGKPMIFITNNAEITILGTTVNISIIDGRTTLKVLKGNVSIKNLLSSKTAKLLTGDQAEIFKNSKNIFMEKTEQTSHLVGRWCFERTGADIAVDFSGNGRDVEVHKALGTNSGSDKGTLSLRSVGDYISLYDLPINRECTIAFWIKGEVGAGRTYIAGLTTKSGRTDPNFVAVSIMGMHHKLYVKIQSDKDYIYLKTEKPVFDDQWHHIALTYSDGDVVLYIDGKRANGKHFKYDSQHNSCLLRNFLIGIPDDRKLLRNTKKSFSGEIDDLRIYDCGLNPAGIKLLSCNKLTNTK